MDELIENYIEYLFNLKKKGVTITDTEHYIEKWDLNIDELILHFQKHIDLNKIFHLPKSSRFYKGHTNREKYELLVKCFTILHNYSKNLLLDFGLYSQKTIQDDNANICDCLVFIPDYSSYLSNLLGYSYDRNKKEWIITDEELTDERQMELGKFCVICGYTRHQLNRLVEINCTNDDEEENSDQIQMYDREEETPEITKWTCEKCSLINNCSDDFCVVCDTEKPTVMSILPQNMLENTRPVKDNHPDTNRMNMKRQLSGSKTPIVKRIRSNNSKIPDSNDDTLLEPSLTAEIKEKERKYEDHTLIIANSDTKTPDSNKLSIKTVKSNNSKTSNFNYKTSIHSSLPIKKKVKSNNSKTSSFNYKTSIHSSLPTEKMKENQWECEACTLINDNSEDFCTACYHAKLTSNVETVNRSKNDHIEPNQDNTNSNSNGFQKSSIENLTTLSLPTKKMKENQWECESCTFINDNSEDFCTTCYHAKPTSNVETVNRSKNGQIKPNHINTNLNSNGFQKSTSENLTTLSLPTEKMKENKWKCEACTFINDNSEDLCKVCFHKQHILDSSVPPVENDVTDIKNVPQQNKNISNYGTEIPYKSPASFHKKQDTSSIPKSPSGQQINREHQKVNNQPPTKRNQNFGNNKQESLPKHENYSGKCKQCSQSCENSVSICDRCKIGKENISPAALKHQNRPANIKRSSSQIEVAPNEKPLHLDRNTSKSVSEAIFKNQNIRSPSRPDKHNEIRTDDKYSPPLPGRPQNLSKHPSNKPLIQERNEKSNKIDKQSQNKSPIHPHSPPNKSTNQGQRTSPGSSELTGARKLRQPIEPPNKGKHGDKTSLLGHDRRVVCKDCGQPLPQSNNKNSTDNVCKCRPKKTFFQKIKSMFVCGRPERD